MYEWLNKNVLIPRWVLFVAMPIWVFMVTILTNPVFWICGAILFSFGVTWAYKTYTKHNTLE